MVIHGHQWRLLARVVPAPCVERSAEARGDLRIELVEREHLRAIPIVGLGTPSVAIRENQRQSEHIPIGHQRVIRGSSEGHQRVIRGSLEREGEHLRAHSHSGM